MYIPHRRRSVPEHQLFENNNSNGGGGDGGWLSPRRRRRRPIADAPAERPFAHHPRRSRHRPPVRRLSLTDQASWAVAGCDRRSVRTSSFLPSGNVRPHLSLSDVACSAHPQNHLHNIAFMVCDDVTSLKTSATQTRSDRIKYCTWVKHVIKGIPYPSNFIFRSPVTLITSSIHSDKTKQNKRGIVISRPVTCWIRSDHFRRWSWENINNANKVIRGSIDGCNCSGRAVTFASRHLLLETVFLLSRYTERSTQESDQRRSDTAPYEFWG